MVLSRVIYELVATESGVIGAAGRAGSIYLDRQLRLEFRHATPVFIAWTWGLLQDSEYHVGWSNSSYCEGPAEVEYDATKTSIWVELVGSVISLQFRDTDQQVLELRSPGAVVFCCSFEQSWHADTLYIGRSLPEAATGPAAG
jgi:hypothetical protein